MTPEKVVEVQKYGREPISLHTPLGEEGDSEFGDLIEDSEAIVPSDAVSFTLLQEQLESVLDTLSEREAGVVRMRFGLTDGQPKTLDEIGKVYGVTRERIRQIESQDDVQAASPVPLAGPARLPRLTGGRGPVDRDPSAGGLDRCDGAERSGVLRRALRARDLRSRPARTLCRHPRARTPRRTGTPDDFSVGPSRGSALVGLVRCSPVLRCHVCEHGGVVSGRRAPSRAWTGSSRATSGGTALHQRIPRLGQPESPSSLRSVAWASVVR